MHSETINKTRRLLSLINNYVWQPLTHQTSTASYWYLPEVAAVYDAQTFKNYQSSRPSPSYLMDYSSKLRYKHANSDGIIILHYPPPTGSQINPEAAFQYALALHDQFLLQPKAPWRERFLHYAEYFADSQTPEGAFPYLFEWYELKPPWYSALSQARGISVLLRAWMITHDRKFLRAACLARDFMERDVSNGGCKASFSPAGCHYYEEYPTLQNAVLNGFMAALLGLWELGHWSADSCAMTQFQEGIYSLEIMFPHFMTEWWTLYDRAPVSGGNLQSPRYHALIIEYLKILYTLSGSQRLGTCLNFCRDGNTRLNRCRAMVRKMRTKLSYR